MLHPITEEIAASFGYTPVTPEEGAEQYEVEPDFQDAPKGAIPCTGNVFRNKQGALRCYWIPAGNNYTSQEKEDLIGWYDIPSLEDIEEWTLVDECYTPVFDQVEADHPDSWLRILNVI